MAKVVGQWDRQAVAAPSLKVLTEILDMHLLAVVASALKWGGWTRWSFRKILTFPAPGIGVRKGVEMGI